MSSSVCTTKLRRLPLQGHDETVQIIATIDEARRQIGAR